MLSLIKRIFQKPGVPSPALAATVVNNQARGLDVYGSDQDPGELAIVKYPPFDQGIPVASCERLIQSQSEVISRIFRTAGVSRQDFARLYEPSIQNLARHVHLLPATSTTYFRGTGGLFRMSLEVALHSLQAANGSVFPSAGGVERRFVMQPKWCLAAFLAGLCSQTYRTVNAMAVMTRDNAQWAPLLEHLHDWCVAKKVAAYFVRWLDETDVHGAQASSAYSVSRIVPHDILQYLAEDNNQVVQAMTAAVSGVETNASENPIARLVAPVITRVIEEDLQRTATNYGHLVIGAHLEPHLIDAMRRLVRGGKWIPNNQASGGRIWIGREGIFLDWQAAANDICNLLARDAFGGVPKDPDTLADLLVKANLLELPARGRYWTITLPVSCDAKDGMVKLRRGTTILPNGFDMGPFATVELLLSASNPGAALSNNAPASPAKTQPQPTMPAEIDSRPHAQNSTTPDSAQTQAPADSPKATAQPQGKKRQNQKSGTAVASDKPNVGHADGKTEQTTQSNNAQKLLSSLKQQNAWLLEEIVKAHGANKLTGKIVPLPHGTGITQDELNAHGMPVMELLEELALKGWLWVDKTRASRRIHITDVDGESLRLVILKPEIAAGLGLPIQNQGS